MSEPFLAEIKIFGFTFPPRGWAQCDGQILPINQNQSLFSLLGTTYGGDGQTTFGLPEMRGRTPLHVGTRAGGDSYTLGASGGEERHVVTVGEMPGHSHDAHASSTDGDSPIAQNNTLGAFNNGYKADGETVALNNAITTLGANQGHENMQPSLTLNFCIALQGLFPSPN